LIYICWYTVNDLHPEILCKNRYKLQMGYVLQLTNTKRFYIDCGIFSRKSSL